MASNPNQAAWLDGPGQLLRVGPADMPKAGAGEIVIRNRAVAINPVSCMYTSFEGHATCHSSQQMGI